MYGDIPTDWANEIDLIVFVHIYIYISKTTRHPQAKMYSETPGCADPRREVR